MKNRSFHFTLYKIHVSPYVQLIQENKYSRIQKSTEVCELQGRNVSKQDSACEESRRLEWPTPLGKYTHTYTKTYTNTQKHTRKHTNTHKHTPTQMHTLRNSDVERYLGSKNISTQLKDVIYQQNNKANLRQSKNLVARTSLSPYAEINKFLLFCCCHTCFYPVYPAYPVYPVYPKKILDEYPNPRTQLNILLEGSLSDHLILVTLVTPIKIFALQQAVL